MKISTKWIWSTVFVFMAMVSGGPLKVQAASGPEDQQGEPAILVGRIAHVEGVVERYDPDQDNWVNAIKDSPIAAGDTLYADEDGRAELILPNFTLARISGETRIQLIQLQDDLTEIDMAFGLARFYSTGSDSMLRATTPFGEVIAPANTGFDLYLNDEQLEMTARQGMLEFVDRTTGETYSVTTGDPTLIADDREVSFAGDDSDPDWQAWNDDRDRLLQEREQLAEPSMPYLPDELAVDAWSLQEYGRWEPVYYQNSYHYFWRPVNVSRGWAPFTVGRWMWWHGDWTWIPYEPFGYMTCHYGSWVFTNGCWFWAPPLRRVTAYSSPRRLFIGFGWYPGRVAWLDHGGYIGWVPLAPQETFYAHRRWGPHTIVVKNTNIINLSISADRFRNVDHAVVLRRTDFFSAKNFAGLKAAGMDRTLLVNNFKVGQGPNPVVADARREISMDRNPKGIEGSRPSPKKLTVNRQSVRQFAVQPVNSAASEERRTATIVGFKKPVEMKRITPQRPVAVAERPVRPINNQAVSKLKSAARPLGSRDQLRSDEKNMSRAGASMRPISKQSIKPMMPSASRSQNPEQTAGRVGSERQIPLSRILNSAQVKRSSPNHPQPPAPVVGKGQNKPETSAKPTASQRRSRILETIGRSMGRGPQQTFK